MANAPHLMKFLETARHFVGLKESGNNSFTDPRGRELWNLWGYNASGTAWCAIFVSACAQKAGIAGKVISKNSYAIEVQRLTVKNCGGTWIDGPLINGGKKVTPIPGDLITFGDSKHKGHSHANHIGIVEYVDGNTVHTIEGNTGNACKRKSYSLGYSAINAYVRPDWSRVGDDITSYLIEAGQYGYGPLYQNKNDRHDMTLRQVGYMDSSYNLSNNSSNLAVSVINYTSVLGDLYDLFAPATVGQPQVSTSQLTGNEKIVVDYFLKMGFSGSAASALAGCLKTYSNILPTFSKQMPNGKYLWGLCGWDEKAIAPVKDQLGYGWNINLSGQLEYFLYDLDTNYKPLLAMIKSQPLTQAAVENVVAKVMANYNYHYALGDYPTEATNYAVEIYTKLIITQAPTVGNVNNLRDQNGKLLTAKKSVVVPASVPQTGIIDDYTSYSCWYSRWAGPSIQRKLSRIWSAQGYPCDKGVATIGGYYCVAVSPKFGTCSDVIVINLEGGYAIPAIICDIKGDDAKSPWGHVKGGGKISIVEWQRVKTKNGKVVTGTGFTDVDKHGFGSWYGKKVLNITNYGKYANLKWG